MSLALLSDLVREHPGAEMKVPFRAVNGHQVEVTAVLERTAVVHDGDITAKRVVRLDALTVEADALVFTESKVAMARLAAGRRGRASSLVTNQRRWNGEAIRSGDATLSLTARLRAEGKLRCHNPGCHLIGPKADFNSNGYCKPCARVLNLRYKGRAR